MPYFVSIIIKHSIRHKWHVGTLSACPRSLLKQTERTHAQTNYCNPHPRMRQGLKKFTWVHALDQCAMIVRTCMQSTLPPPKYNGVCVHLNFTSPFALHMWGLMIICVSCGRPRRFMKGYISRNTSNRLKKLRTPSALLPLPYAR